MLKQDATYDSIAECLDVIEIRDGLGEYDAFEIMDYRLNGATPTIATSETTLYVVFRTCYRISEKPIAGIGFRAIVKKDSTYCLMT